MRAWVCLYAAARPRETKALSVRRQNKWDKRGAFKGGFAEEARLRGRLRDGDEMVDMLVYTRRLSDDAMPVLEAGDYYGGRKLWMEERINAGQRM